MLQTPFTWKTLPQPIVALAPMSGVSDIAMRSIARHWGSDITFSEFISATGLFYKPESQKSFTLAEFIQEERPFIIQLFGNQPEHFYKAAHILNEKFTPDGFDINFGCPARSVIHNGAGSCLFLQPTRAKEIIHAVKEGSGGLPTSIKLRASYKQVTAITFIDGIWGAPFENVTLHMRSYEQVHTGPANWDSGKTLKEYLTGKDVSLIINGGINSGTAAKEALAYTGADGVMVAQSSLGNPFIFREIKRALADLPPLDTTRAERLQTARRHAELMLQYKGPHGLVEMRKHLIWYTKGMPNVAPLRAQLNQIHTLAELDQALTELQTETENSPTHGQPTHHPLPT